MVQQSLKGDGDALCGQRSREESWGRVQILLSPPAGSRDQGRCGLCVRKRGSGVVVGCQEKGGRVQTGRPDRVEGKVSLPAV